MCRAFLACMVCGIGAHLALAQSARYYEFPGGSAYGVSADGSTVVGAINSQAFRWTEAGGMQMLGPGFATSVSGNGSVITGFSGSSIFRWDAVNGRTNIAGASGSYPSISDAGDVITYGGASGTHSAAFLWTASTGVSQLSGEGYLASPVISGDGGTICGYSTIGQGIQPFRWTQEGGTAILGGLPNARLDAEATAISTNGAVLFGAAANSDDVYDTVRWTAQGGLEGLGVAGTSSNVFNFPLPQDANGDGSILVGATFTRAFFWRLDYGPRFVSDVFHDDFGVTPVAALRQCRAISADGRVIAGFGENASGGVAWIAILPSSIPSPGTCSLAGVALLVSARRRRTSPN